MNNAPIVLNVIGGKPSCLSTDVALNFEKRHDYVIERIRALLPELTKKQRLQTFEETFIEVAVPNGAFRKTPAYLITRDGFTLLAMGFTGKKALAFKLAYIDAFNRMEAALHSLPAAAPAERPQPAYMREPWFVVLEQQARQMTHRALARALGIHESTLCQVLRGTGKYGAGTAATTRIESQVLRTFCHARRVRRTPLPRQLNLI